MLTPTASIVRIEETHRQGRLSPAQRKFNTLIRKIDKQKQLLDVWQETIPRYQQLVAERFTPLRKTFGDHQVEMAHLLDRHHGSAGFTRNQKKKIRHLILGLCKELIDALQREDLKPLYNKHSATDFDAEHEEADALAGEFIKSMLESELGIQIGDAELDMDSPEEIAAYVQEKLAEQQRQAEERRGRRKKTAKQLAKESRQQAEEAQLGKSIQTVYRQLVTALHPDREQDPVVREQKTALMQRVTVAYGRKDLLQLLELQLNVAQIDQNGINAIAEDRLKYYNKILQGQLEQLEQEVAQIEFMLEQQAGVSPFETLSPGRLMQLVHEDIESLQGEIERIRHDLITFQEAGHLKTWLKEYRIPSASGRMQDSLFGAGGLSPVFR